MSLGSEYVFESYANEEEMRMKIEQQAANGIWTTNDGRKLSVREMTRNHIENTMKYIRRNDKTDMMMPWLMVFRNELIRRYGV